MNWRYKPGRARSNGTTYGVSSAESAGASLILVLLVHDWNLAAFVIEAFWVAVSLYEIAKAMKPRG